MAEREFVVSIKADITDLRAKFKAATDDGKSFAGQLKAELIGGFKEGFEKGVTDSVRKGTAEVEKFADGTKKAAATGLSSFDSIALKITGIVSALDLAGKAMSVVGGSIEGVFAGITRGGDLNDLSQRLGVTVETLSSLELGAKTAGVSMEGLGTSVQQLSRHMADAAGGSKEAQAGFAALGISVTDSNGKLKSAEEILLAISDKFAGAKDGAAKTAIAMGLLGRSGAQLIPFLNEGADGLRKFQDLSQKLGLNLTTQLAHSMDSIGDSVTVLKGSLQGVQNQLAIGMAPSLEKAAEQIVSFVSNIGIADGRLQALGRVIGTTVASSVENLIGVIDRLGVAASQGRFGQQLVDELTNAVDGLGPKLAAGAESVGRQVGGAIADGVIAGFQVDASALINKIPIVQIINKIRTAFDAVKEDFATDGGSSRVATTFLGDTSALTSFVDPVVKGLDRIRVAQDIAAESAHNFGVSWPRNFVSLNAVGQDSKELGDGFQKMGKSLTDLHAPAKSAGDDANSYANALKKVTDALQATTKSLTDNTDIEQAKTAAIQDGIEAGEDYATIQGNVAQSALDVETAQKLLTGATLESVEAWRAAKIGADESAAANRNAAASLNAIKENESLTAQIGIWEQVKQKLISVAEAHHQIAVQQEFEKTGSQELAEKTVELREENKNLADEYGHVAKTGVDAFGQVDKAFDQVLDGLIAGTLDMEDVWKSFATAMVKEMVDSLGGVTGVFESFLSGLSKLFSDSEGSFDLGSLFSGGSVTGGSKSGKGSSGLFGGGNSFSIDSITNLFGGSGGGGTQKVTDSWYSQNVSSTGMGGGTGGGFSFSGAVAGAGAGYASSSAFGDQFITKTGLPNSLKQVEEQTLNRLKGINEVVTTILGAVFGALAGGESGAGGGIIGTVLGLFDSLVGQTWANRVDRDALRNRGFGGAGKFSPAFTGGGDVTNNWDVVGATDPLASFVMWELLALPTLGTAFRRAGEGVVDASKTFGGEDGKGGLQAKLGDFTRSGAPTQRGDEIALERGLTQSQVDAITGGTGSIFSQLFKDEKFPEDAGRLSAAMGRSMAEFLSRGLAEGMDYSQMLASLNSFAKEAGVDALSSVKGLNAMLEQVKAGAMEFGKLDPTAALKEGADSYAKSLYGVSQIFASDYPAGVNIAAIAIESMQKDGVKAFGSLDKDGHETLINLTKDAENFEAVVAHLAEQGFTINTDEFETRLKDISASATELGESIGGLLDAPSFEAGIGAMMSHLRDTIKKQLGSGFMEQLFGGTNFAAVFEPVTHVLNNLKDYDLTSTSGIDKFKTDILPAIAQGKANLAEYLPILREMYDNWQEVNKAVDEALAPTKAEQLAAAVSSAFDGLGGLIGDAIEAGVAVMTAGGTLDDATKAFNARFGAGLQSTLKEAVFKSILDTAIIQPLIARYSAAFQYVSAMGLALGIDDPRVKAAWNQLMSDINADVAGVAPLLLTSAFDTDDLDHGLTRFFTKMQSDIASINQSLTSSITGTITGAINEAIESGKPIDWTKLTKDLKSSIYEAVVSALVEAMVSSAVIEGGLGVMLEQLRVMSAAAWADGTESPEESAAIAAQVTKIGKAGVQLADDVVAGLVPITNLLDKGLDVNITGDKKGHYTTENGDIVFVPDDDSTRAPHKAEDPNAQGKVGLDGVNRNAPGSVGDETGGRQLIDQVVKPPAEAFADLINTEVIPGLGKFGDSIGDATRALDALVRAGASTGTDTGGDTGGDTDDGTGTGTGGRHLPPRNNVGHAAMGGVFGRGSTFVVGEQGPEVVVYGEDGSMQVIPIDRATMSALINGGAPGYAGGYGGDSTHRTPSNPVGDHGKTRGPGGIGSWSPHVGPDDLRNPNNNPNTKVGPVDVQIELNLDQIIEDFLRGGSVTKFGDALEEAAKKGVIDGLIKSLLESGPIKKAIDDFNNQMAAATEKAMKDGVIDAQEQADLSALADKLSTGIETATKKMAPVVEAVGKALGIGLESSTKEAIASFSGNLEGSLRTFFEGGTIDEMEDAINQAVYEAFTSAIIQALLTTGPLGQIIDEFGADFAEAFSDAMEDGVVSPEEEAHLHDLATGFGADMSAAIAILGPIYGPMFQQWAEDFGVTLTEKASGIDTILSGAMKQALSNGDSFETFSKNVRTALYESVVDGLVKAFIDSAVINGLLAGPLAAINQIFVDIGNGQLTIAEANTKLLVQTSLIKQLLQDPTFKQAWDLVMGAADDIRNSLGLTADGLSSTAQSFDSAADSAANACSAECDLEQKLVKSDEKITGLNDYGRVGGDTDYNYVDVPRDPTHSGADDALPNTTGGGGTHGVDWEPRDNWQRKQNRQHRRDGRDHNPPDDDPAFYGPTDDLTPPPAPELPELPDTRPFVGPDHDKKAPPLPELPDIIKLAEGGIVTRPTFALVGESGPEAVIPLSRGGDSDLVRELKEQFDALRAELRSHGDRTVSAVQADRHTEITMNEEVLIDAWTQAKRVADKAGIPFGG